MGKIGIGLCASFSGAEGRAAAAWWFRPGVAHVDALDCIAGLMPNEGRRVRGRCRHASLAAAGRLPAHVRHVRGHDGNVPCRAVLMLSRSRCRPHEGSNRPRNRPDERQQWAAGAKALSHRCRSMAVVRQRSGDEHERDWRGGRPRSLARATGSSRCRESRKRCRSEARQSAPTMIVRPRDDDLDRPVGDFRAAPLCVERADERQNLAKRRAAQAPNKCRLPGGSI